VVGNSASDLIHAIPGFCQPVSSLSHLIAAGIAVWAAVPLVRLASSHRSRFRAVLVYACCVIATLTISGVYHSLQQGCSARLIMQRIDYYAIWLLIAGTFTAVHGVMCRGFWRAGFLGLTWGYAFVGMFLQVVRFDIFSGLPGLLLYLGLGWAGVISIFHVGRRIGFRAVRPVWMAGIAYSLGAVLEAVGQPHLIDHWVGPHEVFHLAVIVGVALHWIFIRRLLLTYAPAEAAPAVLLPARLGTVG
jgi:channel protein (hemolysin III family)